MRYILIVIFMLVLLNLAPMIGAEPRYARILLGTREAVLSTRAVSESNVVYAPVDILKDLGVNYAAGKRKVTIALEEEAVELDLVERSKTAMIRLDKAAEALNIGYSWDKDSSTARLFARLVSVEFEDGVVTARVTMPSAVSSARIWSPTGSLPWRISIDISNCHLATNARVYPIGDSGIKQIRLGQFDKETARIVLDLDRKTDYNVLTSGLSSEIKVAVGGKAPSTTQPSSSTKPGPVTITGIDVERDGDSRVKLRISTSGTPSCRSYMLGPTSSNAEHPRIVLDVNKAGLSMPKDDIKVEHPLLESIRLGVHGNMVKIVGDATRYVAFTTAVDEKGITITITPPVGSGGKLKDKTIVLDPGHGGKDAGARVQGVREKDLNLLIARKVKAELEEIGANVILTRSDDRYISLEDRPIVADRHGADVFISIHCNAIGVPERVSGIESYYHPGQSSSRALAFAVHNQLIKQTGMKDLGAELDTKLYSIGLFVLRNANVPAVLIECGYMDCTADRRQLCSDEYRDKLAKAITAGLREYFEGRADQEDEPKPEANPAVGAGPNEEDNKRSIEKEKLIQNRMIFNE